MENNENFVTKVTENVEQQPTEEIVEQPKMFTQEDINQAVSKAKARAKAQIEKKYERKYSPLETVLKAATGKENVEEMTETLEKYYENKGIDVKPKPAFSDKDIEVLAKAEAEDIINLGDDDVAEEVDRLSEIGVKNLTPRERACFEVLAKHRQKSEQRNELAKIGVSGDVYNSKEFQDFAGKFNPTIPVTEVYSLFCKTQPKKEIKPMGSMKNKGSDDNGVKDFYSYEEAKKFTVDDFNKNPALYEAVKKSMTQW